MKVPLPFACPTLEHSQKLTHLSLQEWGIEFIICIFKEVGLWTKYPVLIGRLKQTHIIPLCYRPASHEEDGFCFLLVSLTPWFPSPALLHSVMVIPITRPYLAPSGLLSSLSVSHYVPYSHVGRKRVARIIKYLENERLGMMKKTRQSRVRFLVSLWFRIWWKVEYGQTPYFLVLLTKGHSLNS